MAAKVSVVVAVYNVAQYIEECVRSLFGQTLSDMEFIFVDDKSSDGSLDIVKEVLKDYPGREGQVKMLFHEENQGVASTKNDGIQSASGEYVIITDPDDFVELNMMEVMYKKAKETDADMVMCDYYIFGDGKNAVHPTVSSDADGDSEKIRTDLLNRRRPPLCMMRLVRRALFYKEVSAWPVGRYAEDIVYTTVASYYSQRIVHVAVPLYHYRSHDGSLVHSVDEEHLMSSYRGTVENVKIVSDFLERVGASETYWKGLLISKVNARNRLLPIINRKGKRRLWFRTFPEINKVLLCGNKQYHATYKEKVWFIVIALGLYPYCKKYMRGHKMRPFPQWLVW
jgi:glycosyltransferase involved in cell wall biosynthesis